LFKASPGQNSLCDPISKIPNIHTQKKGLLSGSVAQLVEHLPGKREALNSNPSLAKKKKSAYHFMKLSTGRMAGLVR
jgi:hypothetical protein